MAETQAPPPKSKGKTKGRILGIPTPVAAVGGGVVLFFAYRWWKNRQSSSSSTTAAATPSTAATGTDSGIGSFPGTGTGSGGGGGGIIPGIPDVKYNPPNPPANSNTTDVPVTNPAPVTPAPAPADTPAPAAAAPAPTAPAPYGGNSAIAAASQGIQNGVASVAGAAAATPDNPGTFHLKNGTVTFDPTAAVRHGNQVAYGIPNPGVATAAENAGGVVESGSQLMKKGWSNLTGGALYLVR